MEKRIRRYLRPINDSWRVDETYIKVKGEWKYFYRAIKSNRDTINFMLSAKGNRKAAKRFFKKALSSNHNQIQDSLRYSKSKNIESCPAKSKASDLRSGIEEFRELESHSSH